MTGMMKLKDGSIIPFESLQPDKEPGTNETVYYLKVINEDKSETMIMVPFSSMALCTLNVEKKTDVNPAVKQA